MYKDMVCLALGSNLGNKLDNLRKAIHLLSEFFDIKMMSHVIETSAILVPNSPNEWNIPYFNMVIAGSTTLNPFELLCRIKEIEEELGRNMNAAVWSPRIIDIDIIYYKNDTIREDNLVIPHSAIKNRDFLQYLLTEIGYEIPEGIRLNIDNYQAINHFTLNPKYIGIVNITPDSFSDGNQFLAPDAAEAQARKLCSDGATFIEFGAQSTRPGYIEVSPKTEIMRLEEVLERCDNISCGICVDTYFDEVIKYVMKKHNIRFINDQNSQLNAETIKLIADYNAKLVIMLHGTDFSWFNEKIKKLKELGIKQQNIIIDPGIGFGKSKRENLSVIKNIKIMKDFGCEILVGHSRKSFMTYFTNETAANRDLETIAFSEFLLEAGIDYIRVHNIKDHMRFFIAQHMLCI